MSFTFTYKFDRVNIFDPVLTAELHTKQGDLWKWAERRMRPLMLEDARRMVGVRSGRLRRNIRWYHVGNFYGQYFGLKADLPYALLHHQGTKPHTINARSDNPSGMLVFVNRNRVLVHTPKVNHPGTKPNPYLSRTLRHVRMM